MTPLLVRAKWRFKVVGLRPTEDMYNLLIKKKIVSCMVDIRGWVLF